MRAERGPHRRCGTWCRSSLSGRADAPYVVNNALGSFLPCPNVMIDQVPMSACGGTFETCHRMATTSFIGTDRKSWVDGSTSAVKGVSQLHSDFHVQIASGI